MRRAFLLGALAAVAVEVVAAALIIASGVFPVAATNAGGIQDRILAYASTRSIAHHAKDVANPRAQDPAALKAGMHEYRAMCVACHGGPGTDPDEFAAGLHPAAPDLASREIQSFTDGMLYETIAGGIGSTGMPAFGKTHSPEEIWSIVAFVRHLPKLTPEEKQELAQRETGEHHERASEPETAQQGAHPDASSAAPGGGGDQGVHRVSVSNFKFAPQDLEIHVGDTVEWDNADFAAHTATADDRTFDTGRIDGGAAKRLVVKKKGRFPYSCRYHAAMKGTLVVN